MAVQCSVRRTCKKVIQLLITRNTAVNYKSITCLQLMWKLLTGVIAEEMHNYLEREKNSSRRTKRMQKRKSWGKGATIKDCKKRHTSLSTAWIDYRNAYDLGPHCWVNECMEMFRIAENLRTCLQKSMQQWRLSLTANGDDLGEVNLKRRIFQGDSLSSLLFVLSMVPLSLILKKVNACYKWGRKEYKLNHLLFLDGLKPYAKSEEQTNMLVRTVYVFSTDIDMDFGINKCGILTMKRVKIVKSEGMKLPDGEVMKQVGQEGYTYLDITELDKIKETK